MSKVVERRVVSTEDDDDGDNDYYFPEETDEHIEKFNKLTDQVEEIEEELEDVEDPEERERLEKKRDRLMLDRNVIYRNKIKEPFEGLVEGVFNNFGFSYFDVPFENVQQRVLHHMVEKIDMYDETKDSKAVSYFSTIARNKFIQINNKNYDRYKAEVRIDDDDNNFDLPKEETFEDREERNEFFEEMIEYWRGRISNMFDKKRDIRIADALLETFEDREERNEFFEEMIEYWRGRISNMFDKKRDIRIADALLEIFEKRDTIETFNKRQLYVMIREMTGVERTQHITKVVKKFREDYAELSRNYKNTGSVQSEGKFFE